MVEWIGCGELRKRRSTLNVRKDIPELSKNEHFRGVERDRVELGDDVSDINFGEGI